MSGKIKLIIGGMCAGKTSMMLNDVERYYISKKKCLIIKHTQDTRYEHIAKLQGIVTNNLIEHTKFDSITTSTLSLMDEIVELYDVIGITELQFYNDPEYIDNWANNGKIIICDALDGDSNRQIFGQLGKVIPLCEEIIKLRAVCMICGGDASFTKKNKISVQDSQVDIGGLDKYTPVCRKCYFTN